MKRLQAVWWLAVMMLVFALTNGLAAALARTDLPVVLPVLLATCTGLLLLLPAGRRLARLGQALDQFSRGDAGAMIAEHRLDPLNGLVRIVNAVITGDGSAGLRSRLAEQVAQSAAQMERNRLARELHDSIKQQLFSIQMSAATAEHRLEAGAEGALTALREARKSAEEAMVEMNVLLLQLSPAPLEKVGLVQALREQCDALAYRTGAKVNCEISELPPEGWLPPGTPEGLFRIAQEALSNIARHARAKTVDFSLQWQPEHDRVVLRIRDDGAGFDPESAPMGSGLAGIRERVEGLGGEYTLESREGGGTTLCIAIDVFLKGEAANRPQEEAFSPNRVILVGLLGGALASLCLSLPWYFQMRAGHWQGWPGTGGGLELLGFLAAGFALFATGWLAARASSAGGVIVGAAAGAVAGLTPYGLLGAAWAGLRGTQPLLTQGLTFIPEEGRMVALVVSGVGEVFLWANGVYWLLLACGIGLGALGGLVRERARSADRSYDWRKTVGLLGLPFLISSGMALLVCVFLLPVVEASTLDAVARHAPDDLPALKRLIQAALLSGMATPAIFFLAAQVVQYSALIRAVSLAQAVHLHQLHWRAFVLLTISMGVGLVSGLLCLGFLTENAHTFSGYPVWDNISLMFSIGIASANLIFGFLYILAVDRVRMRMVKAQQTPPSLAVYAVLLGAPVVIVLGFNYLFMFGSGWPALAALLVEAALLIFTRVTRGEQRDDPLTALRLRKERSTHLRGAWLAVAYALVAPVLAMGGAGVSIILVIIRMSRFFDSGRLPDSPLPVLTLPMLMEQVYLYAGGGFVVLLAAGLVLTGLVIAGLAGGGLSSRRGL